MVSALCDLSEGTNLIVSPWRGLNEVRLEHHRAFLSLVEHLDHVLFCDCTARKSENGRQGYCAN